MTAHKRKSFLTLEQVIARVKLGREALVQVTFVTNDGALVKYTQDPGTKKFLQTIT